MKVLTETQLNHLLAFNRFTSMDNEEILDFITNHYRGVGGNFFEVLTNQLEEGKYDELSKSLLLFGNIDSEYNCRIYFMEELDELEEIEIVNIFSTDLPNGEAIINYFYKNRMIGFDVEVLMSTFNVSETYLRDKFKSYFIGK